MIEVLIPSSSKFNKYCRQVKELYEKNQAKIGDSNSFDFIIKHTLFYLFLNEGTLVGAIYYFVDNEKLFLNGFSLPKNHAVNLLCLRRSLEWFNGPIYAEAQNRASALCLLRCGFKRVEGNLFCYE